jgi:aryl-alcohol dehydrogenase-like predicted oxidoreductase
MTLSGHATAAGTARFFARHTDALELDHIRRMGDLCLGSVGLGSYLGPSDDATDTRYQAAVARALALGINVVDAAINYRCQRSERAIGNALSVAASSGVPRDEVVVTTKGGFLPFDGQRPADARELFHETVVAPGLARWDEIVAGCHSLAPRFIADQVARSRANLGLATIDVYYLHNPETQLEEVDRRTFLDRMRRAFEVLEQARADGAIVRYGVATWNGLREPREAQGHLSLAELVTVAREVGGEGHGFKVVQLPLNRRMTEACDLATQAGRTLLDAADDLGVYVMSSASILQGKLAPDVASGQAALDWTRTRPGLGTALVGMSRVEHVDRNAAVFRA